MKDSWGWIGIDPAEIISVNAFGNLLIRDVAGRVWRLCPEELACTIVAENEDELTVLLRDPEFLTDWEMNNLVEMARVKLGPLPQGRRYSLKIPGVLGGKYEEHNLATLLLDEMISFSGDLSRQIKDAPHGTQVKIKFVE